MLFSLDQSRERNLFPSILRSVGPYEKGRNSVASKVDIIQKKKKRFVDSFVGFQNLSNVKGVNIS